MINNIIITINDQIILIDYHNDTITINNIVKNITKADVDNLLRIIRLWDNKYINDSIIDGEQFKIEINTNIGTDVIEGKGAYPSNYSSLKAWINDIYDRK